MSACAWPCPCPKQETQTQTQTKTQTQTDSSWLHHGDLLVMDRRCQDEHLHSKDPRLHGERGEHHLSVDQETLASVSCWCWGGVLRAWCPWRNSFFHFGIHVSPVAMQKVTSGTHARSLGFWGFGFFNWFFCGFWGFWGFGRVTEGKRKECLIR